MDWAQAASLRQRSPHPRSPSPKERGAVRSSAVNFEFWILNWVQAASLRQRGEIIAYGCMTEETIFLMFFKKT